MTQTSKFPKISISTVSNNGSYIPLTHNVYATHKVGKITPYMCKYLDANSKVKIGLETLEYNAPMVSPTVGDVKLKHWIYFVGMDKLCPEIADMLAKQHSVDNLGNEFQIQKIPQIRLCDLTALALCGSFCSIYVGHKTTPWSYTPEDPSFDNLDEKFLLSSNSKNTIRELNRRCLQNADFLLYYDSLVTSSDDQFFQSIFSRQHSTITDMDGYCLNARFFDYSMNLGQIHEDNLEHGNNFQIPLANPSMESFFNWRIWEDYEHKKEINVYGNPDYYRETRGVDCSPVSLDSADYVVTRNFTYTDSDNVVHTYALTFAFRFSDFGRAIRDVIIASQMQLDITSGRFVSFLPLFAIYQAYFECQSLQLYRNWKNTAAYKLLRVFATNAQVGFTDPSVNYTQICLKLWNLNESYVNLFRTFINELATMWCISGQDFVSSMTRSPTVSPLVFNDLDRFAVSGTLPHEVANQVDPRNNTTTDSDTPIDQSDTSIEPSDVTQNSQPFINQINHDPVLASILKTISLRMNVNTVIGRKTVDLLRANGFGEWYDLQKAVPIDYGETNLELSATVSTADTSTAEGKGADLGQYGGRGHGHQTHKAKTYKSSVPGYYVMLTTIYVDAGYTQAIDAACYNVDVDDFYRQDFDSKGFEINPKSLVHGSLTWTEEGDFNALNEGFGYSPTYMKFKVQSNKLLGYFAKGELSDVYDTYHMDKLLPIGERRSIRSKSFMQTNSDASNAGEIQFYTVGARISPHNMPISGNIWRYLGRFPWLAQFDRIFKLQDYDLCKMIGMYGVDSDHILETVTKIYSYFVCSPENYTCLNKVYFDSWQKKNPIAESFNTLSEIFSGFSNTAVHKE